MEQEAFMVPIDGSTARVPPGNLQTRTVFHDGRLVQLPEPLSALLLFLWFPFGLALAVYRFFFHVSVPIHLFRHTNHLTGIRFIIRGNPPPAPSPSSPNFSLIVCNHRCLLDPVHISLSLGRPIVCLAYSTSRFSQHVSPIRTVTLTRERTTDAECIAGLLRCSDVIICPEGTTCREPFLLRFSALFTEFSDRIFPVVVNVKQSMFFGTTVRGFKFADLVFFFMNPRREIEIKFLPALPKEETCGGGKAAINVANHVRRIIAAELGFECTTFTRKDKYLLLRGDDGKGKTKHARGVR